MNFQNWFLIWFDVIFSNFSPIFLFFSWNHFQKTLRNLRLTSLTNNDVKGHFWMTSQRFCLLWSLMQILGIKLEIIWYLLKKCIPLSLPPLQIKSLTYQLQNFERSYFNNFFSHSTSNAINHFSRLQIEQTTLQKKKAKTNLCEQLVFYLVNLLRLRDFIILQLVNKIFLTSKFVDVISQI